MVREIGQVQHINLIQEYGNEDSPKIFCKRTGALYQPSLEICEKCPYFVTMGHMDVVVCQWEDVKPIGGGNKIIEAGKGIRELFRVSELVDNKVIKKG